jgi:hypothetical protein
VTLYMFSMCIGGVNYLHVDVDSCGRMAPLSGRWGKFVLCCHTSQLTSYLTSRITLCLFLTILTLAAQIIYHILTWLTTWFATGFLLFASVYSQFESIYDWYKVVNFTLHQVCIKALVRCCLHLWLTHIVICDSHFVFLLRIKHIHYISFFQ